MGDEEIGKEILEGENWEITYERWKEEEMEFKEFVQDIMIYSK